MVSKVELQGVANLKRRIAAMIERGRNVRPLMAEISEILYDEVMENFAAQGRPKWQGLAASTKKRYAQKGYSLEPTLDRRAGGLASSIQTFATASAAGVGTNKTYAAIHNFGGEIKRWPFSSSVRLRTDGKGGLLRQGGSGNLAVFAKRGHKRAVERRFTSAGWTIRMPQREFMKTSPEGLSQIEAAAARFIAGG